MREEKVIFYEVHNVDERGECVYRTWSLDLAIRAYKKNRAAGRYCYIRELELLNEVNDRNFDSWLESMLGNTVQGGDIYG